MATETTIKIFFFTALAIFYLAYTIKYSITFSKSILFSKKIKVLHISLFFLIPFIWVILLKELSKSSLGSYEYPNKVDAIPNTKIYGGEDGS